MCALTQRYRNPGGGVWREEGRQGKVSALPAWMTRTKAGLQVLAQQTWMQIYGEHRNGLEEQAMESYAGWDGIESVSLGSLFLGLKEDLSACLMAEEGLKAEKKRQVFARIRTSTGS
jgi:hypothetical protein